MILHNIVLSTNISMYNLHCTGEIAFLIELTTIPIPEVVLELWWLFAFLTAKDDAAVQMMIQYGLIEVGCLRFPLCAD